MGGPTLTMQFAVDQVALPNAYIQVVEALRRPNPQNPLTRQYAVCPWDYLAANRENWDSRVGIHDESEEFGASSFTLGPGYQII